MQIFSAAQALAVTGTGWTTDVDLTAAPYNVPTTASFALLMVNLKEPYGGANVDFYVRSAASSDALPTATGSTAESYPRTHTVLAPLTAGKFDLYSSHTTASGYIAVAVLGYFTATDGAGFDTAVDITPADPGYPGNHPLLANAWVTLDVSGYVPSTFNFAVISVHDKNFYSKGALATPAMRHCFNYRANGGTEIIPSTDYSYGGYPAGRGRRHFYLVPLSAAGKFDVYGYATRTDGTLARTIMLHGYVKAVLNATPAVTDAYTFGLSTSTWINRTCSRSSKAVLIAFRNTNAYGAPAGARMDGDTGAEVSYGYAAEDIPQAQHVVPLGPGNIWEEYQLHYAGLGVSWSGGRSYTVAYFEDDIVTTETATASDTVVQDMYTPSTSETATASDVVRSGTDYDESLPAAETATAADTVAADRAAGRTQTEIATATDEVTGERLVEVTDDINIESVDCTGEGLTGFVGTGSPEARVDVEGEGLTGLISDEGIFEVYTDIPEIDALWGGIAELDDIDMPIDLTGDGAWGGLAEDGTIELLVNITAAGAGPTGFAGSDGGIYAIVDLTGDTGFSGSSGTGSLYIAIDLPYNEIFPTGIPSEDQAWYVFPVNITHMGVTAHDTPFSSMVVVNGEVYATSSQGIHKVGARTDNGTPITAVLAKGPTDFGNGQLKMASDVFLRLLSEGNFTFDIASETESGQVTVTDGLARVHGCKSDLPRGVAGRELSFTLQNVAGAYFELTEIELVLLLSEIRRGWKTSA